MSIIHELNIYLPSDISGYIYDILSFGIMDSRDAAKYGVVDLIKYPESAIGEITEYCSIDVIKSLFRCIEGKLQVENIHDMTYYALNNDRKDIYDMLNPCRIKYEIPVKNSSKETFDIAISLVNNDIYINYNDIHKYDNVKLYCCFEKVSLTEIFINNSMKMLDMYKRDCSELDMKCIEAFYGDKKNST